MNEPRRMGLKMFCGGVWPWVIEGDVVVSCIKSRRPPPAIQLGIERQGKRIWPDRLFLRALHNI